MIPDLLKSWATELYFVLVINFTSEVQSKLEDALGTAVTSEEPIYFVQRRSRRGTQGATTLRLTLFRSEEKLLLQGRMTAVFEDLPKNSPIKPDNVLRTLGRVLTEPVFFQIKCSFLFPETRYSLLFPLPISLPPEAANLNFDEIRGVRLVKKGKKAVVQEVSLDRQEDGNIKMTINMPLKATLDENTIEYILGSARKVAEQLVKPSDEAEAEST